VVGRVWCFRDITERRKAEEDLVISLQEKEVLLREIHHRVKNNLQLISGLLDMTRMRTKDDATTSILTDMMMKIQTMAQIHTRLYESKQFDRINMEGQIRDQVAAMTNIYSIRDRQVSCGIDAEAVYLPVDQAIPCSLVINEILSNAFKHAFRERDSGNVGISMVQDNGHLCIAIRDDGVGMPGDFDVDQANSLGVKLMRNLVQHQLRGSLMITSRNGTEVVVEFPIRPEGG
jgi:two-component sensor histidine kinase